MHRKLKWERLGVDDTGDIKDEWMETYRAAVPGGWLVTVWADVEVKTGPVPPGWWGGGVTFVPDPEHAWVADTWAEPPKPAKRAKPAK